jgi:FkbM family methyltransferase
MFNISWKRAKKFAKILVHPLYRRALAKGVAGAIEHESVLNQKDFKVVVDIGANRGQFALASRRCHPHAKIVSFEPLAQPAAVFRKVFSGDPNAVLHENAIGPRARKATIHIAGKDDSSSLLPISKRQDELFPGTAEIGTKEITVSLLASLLPADSIDGPALLKLDVQGYELEALKGCEGLLDRFEHIYAECSFVELYEGQAMARDVITFLQTRGFGLEGVYNVTYDSRGMAIQGDFLFGKVG